MNDILSVVMPAFNAQDYAEEAIKSVLLQTVKNWELIIVDDASTDKSLEIFKKYEKIDSRIDDLFDDYKLLLKHFSEEIKD